MIKNEITNSLKVNDKIAESIFDGRYTKTALFMLKAIGIDLYAPTTNPYIKNAFLDDKEYQHDFIRPIFLLIRTKSFTDIGFRALSQKLTLKKEFLVDYDCGIDENEDNLVMYVFQCNEEFKDDYYKFKYGKYSEFSEDYKKLFSKEVLIKGKKKLSIVYGVLTRADYIVDMISNKAAIPVEEVEDMKELWGIPTREREYYRYKIITNDSEEERSSETLENTY